MARMEAVLFTGLWRGTLLMAGLWVGSSTAGNWVVGGLNNVGGGREGAHTHTVVPTLVKLAPSHGPAESRVFPHHTEPAKEGPPGILEWGPSCHRPVEGRPEHVGFLGSVEQLLEHCVGWWVVIEPVYILFSSWAKEVEGHEGECLIKGKKFGGRGVQIYQNPRK